MKQSGDVLLNMQRTLEGPSWRWQLAQRQASDPIRRLPGLDQLSRRTADFVALGRQKPLGEEHAARRYPQIAEAFRFWQDEQTVEQVKVLAVADCPRGEIARRLGVAAKTVALAEELFFDVRPCLDASGWIACRVIIPAVRAGDGGLAARLKLAYYGGAEVARTLLDVQVRFPTDEADRLFDREALLHIKLQEALDAPLESDWERIEFQKLFLDYQIKKSALELEKQKFAHQCEQDRRACELEQLRLKSGMMAGGIGTAEMAADSVNTMGTAAASSLAASDGGGPQEKASVAPALSDARHETPFAA